MVAVTGLRVAITGGAQGIGRAIAQALIAGGAKVVLGDVQGDLVGRTAAELAATGHRLDVADPADFAAFLDAATADLGGLDVLVNNAGISGAVPDRMDVAMFDRLMNVNARGTFLGIKYGIEAMLGTGGGSIVNISSISGLVGQEFVHMGYNAAKAGIHLLTKSAALQFGKDGIRVNSVHPGIMAPMRTSVTAADPALRAKLLETIPLRRAGNGDDTANAVLFLASDEASYITGTELVVDGGFLAG